jgi:hypothetical protein
VDLWFSMREYILTGKEREAVRKFLGDPAPSDLVNVLRFRAKQHLTELKADIELLEKLIHS